MASMLPVSVYGLRVPAGGDAIPGALRFPATFRITMAAIDPSAEAQDAASFKSQRATLKLIREPLIPEDDEDEDDEDEDDDDYDEHDIEVIKARLAGVISEDDEDMSDSEEDSEDEKNGGPSDPIKAKKAKQAALSKKLKEDLEAEAMDVDHMTNGVNGKSKGKAKVLDEDLSSDEDDDELGIDLDDEIEELVLCTLDPEKHYQQALDITVGENEAVYFSATGTHDIFLTGNYVIPADLGQDDDEDEDEYDEEGYDLSPDEDELDEISESEEDALDGLQDPRIEEVDTDEDDAPKLVEPKRNKNKRPAESSDAEDESANLDDMISKALKPEAATTNGEQKLSKKQAKKLKKNDGQAAAAAQEPAKKEQKGQKETPSSDKKKVQFAEKLEQGPTGSPKVDEKKEAQKTGPRNVSGVTVDDKKIGKGRAAKKGDKIEMRYIGKLKSGKQFDANKKGKPFSFKLGVGEVIKGWDVGVVGMMAGGERRLTIPSALAYGKKALPDIPANSDLVFDIKCISVS